jgi:hypothetical protein
MENPTWTLASINNEHLSILILIFSAESESLASSHSAVKETQGNIKITHTNSHCPRSIDYTYLGLESQDLLCPCGSSDADCWREAPSTALYRPRSGRRPRLMGFSIVPFCSHDWNVPYSWLFPCWFGAALKRLCYEVGRSTLPQQRKKCVLCS